MGDSKNYRSQKHPSTGIECTFPTSPFAPFMSFSARNSSESFLAVIDHTMHIADDEFMLGRSSSATLNTCGDVGLFQEYSKAFESTHPPFLSSEPRFNSKTKNQTPGPGDYKAEDTSEIQPIRRREGVKNCRGVSPRSKVRSDSKLRGFSFFHDKRF